MPHGVQRRYKHSPAPAKPGDSPGRLAELRRDRPLMAGGGRRDDARSRRPLAVGAV